MRQAKVGTTMPDSNETPQYTATVADVAAHYGVSQRTVWRWINKGLPHKRPGGGPPRFNLDEVNEWAAPRSGGAA